MRTLEATHGQRRGRIFTTATVADDAALRDAFDRYYQDDEDARRDPLLRAALASKKHLDAVAHPGIDPDDIFAVYLHPGGGSAPLFCCVVVPRARLAAMLKETPVVAESFTLEVASSDEITTASLQAALRSWAERNYPELALPELTVEEYEEILDVLLSNKAERSDELLPEVVVPGPALADPGYEEEVAA
jgi:hypothetical protein